MSILDNLLGNKKSDDNDEPIKTNKSDEKYVRGIITKLNTDGGWGFISSKDVPFTRIFFHWTSLKQNTLRFLQLEKGMMLEFVPIEEKNEVNGIVETKAIKISVVEDRD